MKSGPRVSGSGGRVVLVGNDGLGVRVLQELRELKIAVTAVCARPDAPFARAARDARVTLIVGDPELEETLGEAGVRCVAVERDEDALDSAFVKRLRLPVIIGDIASGTTLDGLRLNSARALLAVTKDDMANLQCALLAQARAPGLRVVLRLFDPDLAARVERTTGIDLSRSVSALAAPAFVAAIFGRKPEAVLPIGTEVLQIVDLRAEKESDVGTLENRCQARAGGRGGSIPGTGTGGLSRRRDAGGRYQPGVDGACPPDRTAWSDANERRGETAP